MPFSSQLDLIEKQINVQKILVHSVLLQEEKQRSLENMMFNMAALELNDQIERIDIEHVFLTLVFFCLQTNPRSFGH